MQQILKLPENYKSLPATDLLDIKLRMEERIDMIDGQIEETKTMAIKPASGFGSVIWLSRAVKSRKAYERDVQRLTLVLDKEKRPAPPPGRFATAFVNVAQRRLNETVFNSILKEAQEGIEV